MEDQVAERASRLLMTIAMPFIDHDPGALVAFLDMATTVSHVHYNTSDNPAAGLIDVLKMMSSMGLRGAYLWLFYKEVAAGKAINALTILKSVEQGVIHRYSVYESMLMRRPIDIGPLYEELLEVAPYFCEGKLKLCRSCHTYVWGEDQELCKDCGET
jgi:hypothetical protein